MLTFPNRFRVETEQGGKKADPYSQVVPGRYGHLYIHDAERLYGVATNGRRLVPKLKRLARLVQDGSDGANLTFEADKLAAVARLIGARRKRQVSPAERARLAEMGRRTRRTGRFAGSKTSADGAGRPKTLPGSLAV